jgi:hypothetical protein
MDYSAIIRFLYPTAAQGADFYLYFTQGSTTPTLGNWNTTELGPQPTIPELQQAWPSVQLYQAQQQQLTLLSNNAKQAIIGGFSSSALGSAHLYPSGQTDQLNLTASVVASMLPGVPSTFTTLFYCATGTPAVWAFTPHTAAQIQQVGVDAKAWIQSQQATHATLGAEVMAATTVAAVQAVVWS